MREGRRRRAGRSRSTRRNRRRCSLARRCSMVRPLLPLSTLERELTRRPRRRRAGTAAGLPALHGFINTFTARVYKPGYSDWATVVNAGSTDAWGKIVTTLLESGDGILAEEWTYPSALACVSLPPHRFFFFLPMLIPSRTRSTAWPSGMKPVALSMDGEGIIPEAMDALLGNWNPDEHGGMRRCVLLSLSVSSRRLADSHIPASSCLPLLPSRFSSPPRPSSPSNPFLHHLYTRLLCFCTTYQSLPPLHRPSPAEPDWRVNARRAQEADLRSRRQVRRDHRCAPSLLLLFVFRADRDAHSFPPSTAVEDDVRSLGSLPSPFLDSVAHLLPSSRSPTTSSRPVLTAVRHRRRRKATTSSSPSSFRVTSSSTPRVALFVSTPFPVRIPPHFRSSPLLSGR